MVALLSDIEAWLFVTVIPVAPIAAFTCSGLTSNPASSRSSKGTRNHRSGGRRRLGVAHCAAAPGDQMTATASSALGWRTCSSPFQPCPTVQRGAISPIARRVKKWCSNAVDAYVRLNGVS
jgi:hypothetical protein